MNLYKYNIFSNIRNYQFKSNFVEDDKDSSFNSKENSIHKIILIPLESNNIFRANNNSFDNDNYGNNLAPKNSRIKFSNNTKPYFKARIEKDIPRAST